MNKRNLRELLLYYKLNPMSRTSIGTFFHEMLSIKLAPYYSPDFVYCLPTLVEHENCNKD